MKNLVLTLALVVLTLSTSFGMNNATAKSATERFELATRYISLANNWRAAKNYEKSQAALDEGFQLLQSLNPNTFNTKYWTATYYFNKAILKKDMNDLKDYERYLYHAQNIFNSIIKMENGSQDAVQEYINTQANEHSGIDEGDNWGGRFIPEPMPGKRIPKSSTIDKQLDEVRKMRETIKRQMDIIQQQRGEIESMKTTISTFDERISAIENNQTAKPGLNENSFPR